MSETNDVDLVVMHWPWDSFPEDLSTWECCVKEHAKTKKAINDFVDNGRWTHIAYARLGNLRDNMTSDEISIIQKFLGPLEA